MVSGGTQGCGEAIALACAEEGAAGVAICGRQEDKGAAVVKEIEARGSKGLYVKVDEMTHTLLIQEFSQRTC